MPLQPGLKKRRILIKTAYIVFLCLILEGSARIAFLIPGISRRLRSDDDYSWRRDWIQRHQVYGRDIYYTFDRYDSTKGWMPKSGLRNKNVFYDKVLNTNSTGFRGKQDFSYTKDPDKFRIVVAGDSFTFGDEVSDDETYPYFLQQMLPHAEIINTGVHGYGHDQMLILLKEEGLKFQPDVVIIGFLPLDMPRNLLKFRDYAKPRFILKHSTIELTETPVPAMEEILKSDSLRPRVIDLYSILSLRVQKLTGLYDKRMKELTSAIFKNMFDLIDSVHAIPILVYLPHGDEIHSPLETLPGEEYMYTLCGYDKNARCFSARPQFAENLKKGENFNVVEHWNAAGNRTIAESISNYLTGHKILSQP